MELDWITEGPGVTNSVDAALSDLEEHGAAILADALEPGLLRELHDATYHAAHTDRKYGLAQQYEFGEDDDVNQRIWNMPSHDPVFCELAELPLAIDLVTRTLSWPASLSSMAANILHTGSGSMLVHCDQGHLPGPLTQSWVLNLGWLLDDFTPDNGGTLFLPGSHRLNGERPSEEAIARMIPAVAPAGSLLILEGRTWHTNGINLSDKGRAAIFAVYTFPVLLPQENWFLSLNPSARQFGSETLQTLFGFRPQILGRVNGMDGI
ncbi:MAG: phytanoyl-CoA dioxygenase family protein [Novosphingobium sp.]|nr:phytanoyl-CoA dioxygenase family protein [Novosphingobium sp.]